MCLLGIALNTDLRDRYQLYFFSSQGESTHEDGKDSQEESLYELMSSVGKEAASQGGRAMTLDLCVQLNYTIGVYMSGTIGADQMYQVSAMQSAMPMFGTAWAVGLSYTLKLRG